MVEKIIYSILVVGIGCLNLYYASKFLRDPEFARRYIESSPKAWIWKKMLGTENAIKLTKSVFAPLGVVLGIGLVIFGIFLFFI